MEWLWVAGAALVGSFIGAWLLSWVEGPQLSKLGLTMASDREPALCTLRRELANYMVRLNPEWFSPLQSYLR
jgi:hypothetical protein